MATTSPKDCTLRDTTTHSTTNPTQCRKSDNTGAKIALNATRVTYTVEAFTNTSPIPNQDISKSWSERLSYGDFVGFNNPVINVEGVIDVEQATPSEGSYEDYQPVTLKIIQKFIKAGHILEFEDIYDSTKTANNGKYRIHSLDSNEDCSAIKVMIKSFDVESTPRDSKEGRYMKYSLQLIEVKS